ncbi:MAG: hypothetical protein ACXADA_09185 [Candidatus Hodarchaeales archaeon]
MFKKAKGAGKGLAKGAGKAAKDATKETVKAAGREVVKEAIEASGVKQMAKDAVETVMADPTVKGATDKLETGIQKKKKDIEKKIVKTMKK